MCVCYSPHSSWSCVAFHRQFELPSPPTGLTPTLVFSTSSGISQENSAIAAHHKYIYKQSGDSHADRLNKILIFLPELELFTIENSYY